MYLKTVAIIEKSESQLLGLPLDKKLWNYLTRYILFPISFLQLGLFDIMKPLKMWLGFTCVFGLVALLYYSNSQQDKDMANTLMILSLSGPIVLVVFAIPSTYAFSGVKNENVEKISEFLVDEGLASEEKIELFEENISLVGERVSSRVSFYKWLLGISWSIYFLFLNTQFRIFLKIQPENINEILSDNFIYLLFFAFFSLTIFFLIASYKRATEILIKSIQFACVNNKSKNISD